MMGAPARVTRPHTSGTGPTDPLHPLPQTCKSLRTLPTLLLIHLRYVHKALVPRYARQGREQRPPSPRRGGSARSLLAVVRLDRWAGRATACDESGDQADRRGGNVEGL